MGFERARPSRYSPRFIRYSRWLNYYISLYMLIKQRRKKKERKEGRKDRKKTGVKSRAKGARWSRMNEGAWRGTRGGRGARSWPVAPGAKAGKRIRLRRDWMRGTRERITRTHASVAYTPRKREGVEGTEGTVHPLFSEIGNLRARRNALAGETSPFPDRHDGEMGKRKRRARPERRARMRDCSIASLRMKRTRPRPIRLPSASSVDGLRLSSFVPRDN